MENANIARLPVAKTRDARRAILAIGQRRDQGPVGEALRQVGDLTLDWAPDARTARAYLARRAAEALLIVGGPENDRAVGIIAQLADQDLPIAFLPHTACDQRDMLALDLGADIVLDPRRDPRLAVHGLIRLMNRARAAHTAPAADTVEAGPLLMDAARHLVTWRGTPVKLSATEFDLLHLLASRPMVVQSRDSIQDAIYASGVYVDDRTVDSHIKRVRRKVRAIDPDFDAIETLYGLGYRFNAEQGAVRAARPRAA